MGEPFGGSAGSIGFTSASQQQFCNLWGYRGATLMLSVKSISSLVRFQAQEGQQAHANSCLVYPEIFGTTSYGRSYGYLEL
jgi:hypothetical protein